MLVSLEKVLNYATNQQDFAAIEPNPYEEIIKLQFEMVYT